MENHAIALNRYVAVYGHTCNTMVGCFLAACREDVENFVWTEAYDDLDKYIGTSKILAYEDFLGEEGTEDVVGSEFAYLDYLGEQIGVTVKEFDPDNEAHLDILSECNNEWYEV